MGNCSNTSSSRCFRTAALCTVKPPSSRFSRTLRFAKIDGVWNLRPIPSEAISFSRRPESSVCLPKITRPAAGWTFPEITSSSVVLPAPLGPMTTRSSR